MVSLLPLAAVFIGYEPYYIPAPIIIERPIVEYVMPSPVYVVPAYPTVEIQRRIVTPAGTYDSYRSYERIYTPGCCYDNN